MLRRSLAAVMFVLVAALALAASTVLLVDYVRPTPLFCGQGGGCDAIKLSRFAWLGGVIPMPALGIASFLVALGLLWWPGPQGRRAQVLWATASALIAASLLMVQARMGKFCVYCTVVDVSALALLGLAIHRYRAAWDMPRGRLAVGLPLLLVAVAIGSPIGVAATRKPSPPIAGVPDVIRRELGRTPAGRITVIDFVDFECPWCRKSHAALAPFLEANRESVRVVRVHVPLEHLHAHAELAARVACCGEEQSRGEAMADALFRTDPEALDEATCERLARELGLDVGRYRECVGAERTKGRVGADRETFHDAKGHGLPLLYIGDQRLEGAQTKESLELAFARARSRS